MHADVAAASSPLCFRWLGTAGLALTVGDVTLVIDPYVTRVPTWQLIFGTLRPDRRRVADYVGHCDDVLVTHAHFDHLLDVPAVLAQPGAVAFGSSNTCRLLAASGVPAAQIREIDAGHTLSLGAVQVDVLSAEHVTFWGRTMARGPLRADVSLPLRAWDYRMDSDFSFLVRAEGGRWLIWSGPGVDIPPVDVAFVNALSPGIEDLCRTARPGVIVPIHWDDFTRSLSKPLRPMFYPTGKLTPFVRRFDQVAYRRMLAHAAPGSRVLFPEMFRDYDLDEL